VRGVYARKDLPTGYEFDSSTFDRDFYLAIPLLKGQLSCREILNGEKLTQELKANEPLTINQIDGPYSESDSLKSLILGRGL
jgi:N-acetylneuraminate synthase